MKDMFNVSASPHVRSGVTTAGIMRDVVIALLPAALFGVFQFGLRAFLVLLTCVVTSVLSEYIYRKLMKKPALPYECSAIVTGLLLGMNLPSTLPLWMAMIGSIFAIVVVKELYGGLGQNFMNPALAARCFLLICFAGRMVNFAVPAENIVLNGFAGVDGISGATPLAILKEAGSTVTATEALSGYGLKVSDLFFGFTGGVIGETSAVAILIGALYLVCKKIISLRIPVTYILTFTVFAVIFGGHGFEPAYIAAQLCGGGLMLGAFFMATDYVTSPITKVGQIVFGVLLGVLTGLFRIFGGSAEGVSYAIIICNLLVPLIEKYTVPKAFGMGGKQYVKK